MAGIVLECLKWAVVILIPLLVFAYLVQPKSTDSVWKYPLKPGVGKKDAKTKLEPEVDGKAPSAEEPQLQKLEDNQQLKPETSKGSKASQLGFTIAFVLTIVGEMMLKAGYDFGLVLVIAPWVVEGVIFVIGCFFQSPESKPKKEGEL